MKKIIASILILFAVTANASNPASEDYVNNLIQQVQTQINNLSTQINTLSSQVSSLSSSSSSYTVGQFLNGGIVFYVDPNPTSSGHHGLIVAINEQSSSTPWATVSTTTNATADAIYAGATNTSTIISTLGSSAALAANFCATYTVGGVAPGTWYLPSATEITLMLLNRPMISQQSVLHGGSSMPTGNSSGSSTYWSSTESTSTPANALAVLLGFGQGGTSKTTSNNLVRCIRYF